MEIILMLMAIILLFFIINRNKKSKISKQSQIPINIEITSSIGRSTNFESEEKFKPILTDTTGGWILNPGAAFRLTLLNANKETALQVRKLLDDDEIQSYKKTDLFSALFAEKNICIKEIEDYKKKYQKIYFDKIDQLKNQSSDWESAGDKDREDLMIDFRQEAIKSLYERANCNLEVLFEYDPTDRTIDDELIREYGFENISTYVRHSDKLDKVRVIPNDHYLRIKFEKLTEVGLCIRGKDIPVADILPTLTLNELNAIAKHPEKEFKRKNNAIEYILSLDSLDDIISKVISYRELFRLLPIPNKFSTLNLNELSQTWAYHAEESRILFDTYYKSFYNLRDLRDHEFVKGYTIEPADIEDPCPCAKERSQKKYPKGSPPKVPCHIGCNCYLSRILDY